MYYCEKPTLSEPTELTFCTDKGKHYKRFSEGGVPVPLPGCIDTIDADPEVVLNINEGYFGIGGCDITAVCTDDAGLSDTLTYTVTIEDCDQCEFGSEYTDGQEIDFNNDEGEGFATVDLDTPPTVSDNSKASITPTCSIDERPLPTQVDLNGECEATATIRCTASDEAGNECELEMTVRVTDNEAPKIDEVSAVTIELELGQRYLTYTPGDAILPHPMCRDNGREDHPADCPYLAAEKKFGVGSCDIVCTCDDPCNPESPVTTQYTLTINHCDQCEFGSEYTDGQEIDFNNDEGEGFATVDLDTPPTVSDNSKASITPTCSIDEKPLPTQVDLNGECEATATIRCTASDEAGNECELEMTVRVTDNEAPKIDEVSAVTIELELGQRYLTYTPGDAILPHPMCRDNGREDHPADCPYLAAEKKFGVGSCDIVCTCDDPCNPESPVTTQYTLTINRYVHPQCEDIFQGGDVIQAWYKDKLALYGGLIVEGVTVVLSCAPGKILAGNQELTCVGAGDGTVQWDQTPGQCEDATAVGDITCSADYTAVYSADGVEAYCYRLESYEQVNHDAMKQKCEATGGYLAEINSFLEHETVVQFLNDQNLDQMFVWISTNDIDVEGSYVDGNGNPTELTLWCPDAPTGEEEDCVIDSPMGWNDVKCSNEYYGLCEQAVQGGTGSNHLKP
nr:uncharacterized protein LOC129275768 [Lytechinus pictus]